jgi:hypothetical protein
MLYLRVLLKLRTTQTKKQFSNYNRAIYLNGDNSPQRRKTSKISIYFYKSTKRTNVKILTCIQKTSLLPVLYAKPSSLQNP